MFDICVIGHITKDIIRNKHGETIIPGGVPYYCLMALNHFRLNNCLVTKIATRDRYLLDDLNPQHLFISCQDSKNTTIFENNYPEDDTDIRIQKVNQIADPFTSEDIPNITSKIYHLGPLTQEDISLEILQYLSIQGKISLDIQGFLRQIKNGKVKRIDWAEKKEGLTYVNFLKADEIEAQILSGEEDVKKAAIALSHYGIDEIVITRGSQGSLIYAQEQFYAIPSFPPKKLVDATGCGDTYMAGYLYKRLKHFNIDESGRFAAAIASLKLGQSGAFQGSEEEIQAHLSGSIGWEPCSH
jgi:sugar/nucleoside kinase (ribokinase family)